MRNRTTLFVLAGLLVLALAVSACGDGSSSNSAAAQAILDQQKTRDAASVVTPEADADLPAAASGELAVGMASYSASDLEGMTQVTASTDDGDVTGASMLAVLEAAGITDGTVTLTAADGYTVDVALADLDDTAVIAVEDGMFNVTIPTLPSNTWVDDVVSITAS